MSSKLEVPRSAERSPGKWCSSTNVEPRANRNNVHEFTRLTTSLHVLQFLFPYKSRLVLPPFPWHRFRPPVLRPNRVAWCFRLKVANNTWKVAQLRIAQCSKTLDVWIQDFCSVLHWIDRLLSQCAILCLSIVTWCQLACITGACVRVCFTAIFIVY